MSMLALKSTGPFAASVPRRRNRPYRARGEAQRQIVLHICEHKEKYNGEAPSYAELAEYMQYSHKMCARSVVQGIVARNRPGKPYLIYVNDKFGLQWLDLDDRGRIVLPLGKWIARYEERPAPK